MHHKHRITRHLELFDKILINNYACVRYTYVLKFQQYCTQTTIVTNDDENERGYLVYIDQLKRRSNDISQKDEKTNLIYRKISVSRKIVEYM